MAIICAQTAPCPSRGFATGKESLASSKGLERTFWKFCSLPWQHKAPAEEESLGPPEGCAQWLQVLLDISGVLRVSFVASGV